MFVRVALDLPVDSTFTYKLTGYESYPPEIGKRVIVPFGKGNRLKTGIIVDVFNELEETKFTVKEVFDVPDPFPLFTERTLELCSWISEFYCSSFGEALFRFLPEGFLVEEKLRIKLKNANLPLSPNEEKLITLLQNSSSGELSLSTLRRKLKISNLLEVVKRLSKKGALEILEETKRDAVNRVTYLRLTGKKYGGRSKKVLELLNFIAQRKEVSIYTVRSLGFSRKTVKKLVDEGILEEFLRIETVPFKPQNLKEKKKVVLTPSQNRALSEILSQRGIHLLFGVTGSGKMEVYLQAAKEVVERGRRVLILVPELLLTPELRSRVEDYFGSVGIFHGKLSRREKVSAWISALTGEYSVFIGTRQAVLLPVKDLGLIIVDEEQDSSYKEQKKPYYNARDVAVKRGEVENITTLLVSATPSIDSFKRAKEGKFFLHHLKERVSALPLPRVELLDLKTEEKRGIFTEKLLRTLERVVKGGEQGLLYINRRGYYSKIFCLNCGFLVECKNCKVPLTYHKSKELFICHVCGKKYRPVYRCPKCGKLFEFKGYGTERVEEELKLLYPDWKIVRLDLDTVKDPIRGAEIIRRIKEGYYNVIVGTNIAIKGHNFPRLSFVGVLIADLLGGPPDFFSSERIFQSIVHATGRAGRFIPGSAIVQAFNVDLPSIRYAVNYDYSSFYEEELLTRKIFGYPPFKLGVLLEFQIENRKEEGELKRFYDNLKSKLRSDFEFPKLNPAPIPKVSGNFRYIALLRTDWESVIEKLKKLKNSVSTIPKKFRVKIDVNPVRIS